MRPCMPSPNAVSSRPYAKGPRALSRAARSLDTMPSIFSVLMPPAKHEAEGHVSAGGWVRRCPISMHSIPALTRTPSDSATSACEGCDGPTARSAGSVRLDGPNGSARQARERCSEPGCARGRGRGFTAKALLVRLRYRHYGTVPTIQIYRIFTANKYHDTDPTTLPLLLRRMLYLRWTQGCRGSSLEEKG